MNVSNIYKSIRSISRNENINRVSALSRYIAWQAQKASNRFPCILPFSESELVVHNKEIANGVGGLVKCQGMYDYNNMGLIKELLQHHLHVLIDIGANVGTYALIASEVNGAQIYAFEPHPFTFELLSENIQHNNRSNVQLVNKAVAANNTKLQFTNMPGSSVNKIVDANHPNNKIIEVDSVSLDAFCEERGIVPEIVKIDVEGFEKDVLSGFGAMLNKAKICFVEISESRDEILSQFEKAGFFGPYYHNFRMRTFFKNKADASFEDPIFIERKFKSVLKSSKFHFVE